MAVTFNPTQMITSEFYQEHYSRSSLSCREIEEILGIEIEDDIKNFVDSMTDQQAYDYLCKVLNEV